jgi:hypothetical protein
MKAICCLLALSGFAIVPLRADASPIAVYDNFGPGQSYDTGDSWAVLSVPGHSGQALAVPFTPATDVTLDAVLLPLNYLSGTNSVVVSLRPDVSGQPGATPLESFSLTGLPMEPSSTVFQLNSVSDPVLSAGTTYWIARLSRRLRDGGGMVVEFNRRVGILRHTRRRKHLDLQR